MKGGHLTGPEAVDVLHDGRRLHELRLPRVETRHTHGTGCMTADALAAGLDEGRNLLDAVARAKQFVAVALTNGLDLGAGDGTANPLAWLDGGTRAPEPEISRAS